MLSVVLPIFCSLQKLLKRIRRQIGLSMINFSERKLLWKKSLVLGPTDPSLWVTHMLSRRTSTHLDPDREICGLFNQKRCYFSHCKFLHSCQICKSLYHPALECPNKFKSKDRVSHSSP